MTEHRKGRLPGIVSLVFSASLAIPYLALRLNLINFRDDLFGYHALGFFFTWWLVSSSLAALLAVAALCYDRRSRLALFALICALLPLSLLVGLVFTR